MTRETVIFKKLLTMQVLKLSKTNNMQLNCAKTKEMLMPICFSKTLVLGIANQSCVFGGKHEIWHSVRAWKKEHFEILGHSVSSPGAILQQF